MTPAEVCEWNPGKGLGRMHGERRCPKPASVCVGADGEWHLCEDCAKLPAFKRFRKRTPLHRAAPPTDKGEG